MALPSFINSVTFYKLQVEVEEIVDDPSPVEEVPPPPKKPKPMSQDLQELRAKRAKIVATNKATVLTIIKRAMTTYESTGDRGTYLEKIRAALKTIAPTSVEAERAFRKVLHSVALYS